MLVHDIKNVLPKNIQLKKAIFVILFSTIFPDFCLLKANRLSIQTDRVIQEKQNNT